MQQNRPLVEDHKEKEGGYTWLIIVIIALALIVLWVTFNRGDADVVTNAPQETSAMGTELSVEDQQAAIEAGNQARITAAKAEARADLAAVQTQLEADATYEDVQDELEQIEENLAAAYTNTSAGLQAEYREIQRGLESLGNSIRNQTGDALDAIADFFLMLEAGVRTN